MMDLLKRTFNSLIFGNPYGKRHSIHIESRYDQLPRVPRHLVKLEKSTVKAIQENNGDDFDKLRLVYDFLNEYNQFVQTFSVCSAGCSHCCKIDVATTRLEAIYIEKHTGIKANRSRKRSRNHTNDCPFLAKDGTCKIYEARPFNCRTFHTLDDAKFCESQGSPHIIYGSSSTNPPYNVDCYISMSQILNSLNKNGEFKDIRDYF